MGNNKLEFTKEERNEALMLIRQIRKNIADSLKK